MLQYNSIISMVQYNGIILTEKFDVLRGRLLGNHNDFHLMTMSIINEA